MGVDLYRLESTKINLKNFGAGFFIHPVLYNNSPVDSNTSVHNKAPQRLDAKIIFKGCIDKLIVFQQSI